MNKQPISKQKVWSAISLLAAPMWIVPVGMMPIAANLATVPAAVAAENHQKTIQDSSQVFQEMMNNEKTRIPASLLRRAQAIAIIPNIKQAGFLFGGRRGTGILSTQYADGTWSNPVFVNVTGGSFGLQVGAKSTDMVLVFPTRASLNTVLNGRSLSLGGNIAGTAGSNEGRAIENLDDRSGSDKIFAYSRSTGLFGGVAFEGAKLAVDSGKNREFYGRSLSTVQILNNRNVAAPSVVSGLKTTLSRAQ